MRDGIQSSNASSDPTVSLSRLAGEECWRRVHRQGDWAQFAELGRQRGLDYLAVVVVSSTEQEYPVTLFLGLTMHAQPGFRRDIRRDNWSLLEFVLLDLKQHAVVAQAEGRGWAPLDRPSAPGIDQWYPAIFLRP
jgi:hypothetical protein